MHRREFFAIGAAGTVASIQAQPAPKQTFLAGLVPGRPAGTSQPPPTPMERFWKACDDCSAMGVHHIEVNTISIPVAQTYDTQIEKFQEDMAKREMRVLGLAMYAHWHLTETLPQMIGDYLRVARFLEAVGGKYIAGLIAPASNLGNGDEASYRALDAKAVVANCNAIGKRVHEETGIGLGYHPEQGDLRTGIWKTIVEDTDPRHFHFWPDVGHLTACGIDPLETYKKYRSRMIGTHLRDFSEGRMVPFGGGVIKLPELIAYLRETRFTGCVMGEGGGGSRAMRDYMVDTLSLEL